MSEPVVCRAWTGLGRDSIDLAVEWEEGLDHVGGESDEQGGLRTVALASLSDPVRRVGRKLGPSSRIESSGRLDQADDADLLGILRVHSKRV